MSAEFFMHDAEACDQIARLLNLPDPDGWDIGLLEEIAAVITSTGREIGDVVAAYHAQQDA